MKTATAMVGGGVIGTVVTGVSVLVVAGKLLKRPVVRDAFSNLMNDGIERLIWGDTLENRCQQVRDSKNT